MMLGRFSAKLLTGVTALWGSAVAESRIEEPPKSHPRYAIYDSDGNRVSASHVASSMKGADVLLFGETHLDAGSQQAQADVLKALFRLFRRSPCLTGSGAALIHAARLTDVGHAEERPVVLSMEMFERDVQHVMDEFLLDLIREVDFLRDSRAWPNYIQSYRTLVDMAKQHAAPVVCANAPRRLVALVGRSGPAALGSLPDSSRAHLPPLPLHPPSDKYAAKVQRELAAAAAAIRAATAEGSSEGPEVERAPSSDASRGAVATARSREEESQIAPDREQDSGRVECPASGMSAQSDFVAAQGVWDATMAHSIAEVLRKRPGAAVMHVCGRFHCEDRLGIPEHLSRYAPTARVVCVMSIAARDGAVELSREEFMREIHRDGLADFVCVTAGSVSTSVGAS